MIYINEKVGEIRENSKGTPMKIIAFRNYDDIDVQFLDEFYYIKEHQTYSNFKSGQVRNPYDKTVLGTGYLGVGRHKIQYSETMTNTKTYMSWKNMIDRCYCENHKERNPAYYDISTVCKEWHNFQNFAEWLEKNRYKVNERLHLDKDILFPNCKMYSPKTCILTPQRINMLFSNKPNKRGLPNGITKQVKGYLAKYGGEKLGVFPTLEEAYQEYAKAKEKKIKEVADEYKDIIPKKLYDALYAYKVDIRNDKNYVAA